MFAHRSLWMEINIPQYLANIQFMKSQLKPQTKFNLCVKANAYGHGLTTMAQIAEPLVDSFSVATINEAILLREARIQKPIIILSPHHADETEAIARYQLEPIIGNTDLLNTYADTNKPIKLHLKIDTGMSRLGCLPEEAVAVAKALKSHPNLTLEGLCTHFADSEEDPSGTTKQIEEFEKACSFLKEANLLPLVRHACNSAGILHHLEAHYEMVRSGSATVGYVLDRYPHPKFPEIRFCASLKSRVLVVKHIPAGAKVSYGGTWTAQKPTTIGLIPVGYADGLPIGMHNKTSFLIDGRPVPVRGKLCMDQTMIDITNIPNPLGKEVLIFGDHPTQNLSNIAPQFGASVSSILTLIPNRVPRIYNH
ncbi:MAG: alanine racemase [Brevinema sp.]